MPLSAWEPAAGEGHMAEVLKEYLAWVRASDVFDYGCGDELGSFVGCGPDVITVPQPRIGLSPIRLSIWPASSR